MAQSYWVFVAFVLFIFLFETIDVVNTVSYILGSAIASDLQACAADINSDGNIDLLDAVQIVQIILNWFKTSILSVF